MAVVSADTITIVSGLPRSGTSMMMRMIDAGGVPALTDNVRKADEDNPRGYFEFEPVKKTKEDPSWLDRAGGHVVKMVYRLLYDLPPDRTYHVVFTRRRLEEVIRSQDVMLSRLGRESGNLPEDKLLGMFRHQLQEFDEWIGQQPNFNVLYTDYNETITTPRPTVEAVNRFLGGGLDVDAMLRIVEPNLYRQRADK